MANLFRDSTRRKLYEAMLDAFRQRTSTLFTDDGQRRRGTGSMAGYFWQGFDHIDQRWDASSRRMLGYACFRAGADARKFVDAGIHLGPVDVA